MMLIFDVINYMYICIKRKCYFVWNVNEPGTLCHCARGLAFIDLALHG